MHNCWPILLFHVCGPAPVPSAHLPVNPTSGARVVVSQPLQLEVLPEAKLSLSLLAKGWGGLSHLGCMSWATLRDY